MSPRVRILLLVIVALGCGSGMLWMRGRAREGRVLDLSPRETERASSEVEAELSAPKPDHPESVTPKVSPDRIAVEPMVENSVVLVGTPESFSATGTVRGEVRSDFGDLVLGCEVVLESDGMDRMTVRNGQVVQQGPRVRSTTVTDGNGQFVFSEVDVGSLRLFVENPGSEKYLPTTRPRACAEAERPWVGAQCRELSPDGGTLDPVVVVLRSAARVEGRIVDPSGDPVSDATVYPDHLEEGYWQETPYQQTDEEGRFVLVLHPGEVHLRTSISQYSNWTDLGVPPELELVLAPGETLDLGDIALGGGGASLLGRVTDANGAPAATIQVVMTRSGGVGSMSTESLADGSFTFLGVYPGRYQLAVAPDGAILGNPRRFLHAPGPVQELVVSGEVGEIDLGDFELRFDGSFHLYAEVVFENGHVPAWEDMRARAFLPSGIELKDEDLEFQSRTKFEWHVREPELFSEVVIEVSELDPETKEPLWTKTVNCVPKRHERRRVRIPVE